jgi:prepilin-type N-terminal cleavage/methylation domain-containing protein
MTRASQCGFTLLEVLLVVAIIAVLAAIAIPQYRNVRARSLDAKVESAVRHVATSEEAYYAGRQQYTRDLADLDGVVVVDDITIKIDGGNSGDIASSFRVRAAAAGAAHRYEWVSDPAPGEPNLFFD